MTSVGRIIATLGLAMALGGCVTYSEADSYVNDVRAALHRSAEDGPVQVTLIGNPFAGSGSKLAGMVRAAMDRHLDWLPAKVIIAPAGAAGDRILFVIDPARVHHTRDICDDAEGVTFEPAGPIMRIGAIYCTKKVVSEVWARLDRPASAGDAVLAEAIGGLAWRVIPWVTKDSEEMPRMGTDS